MRKVLINLFLVCTIIFAGSFKAMFTADELGLLDCNSFVVQIDGVLFDAREDNNYSAQLINNPADLNTTSVNPNTSITLFGNDVCDRKGNYYPQRIVLQYAFNEGATGPVSAPQALFVFKKQKFYSTPENMNLNVTKVEWTADRKSFVMSADFSCKVRRKGPPNSVQPIIGISGKIENMTVMVPDSMVNKTSCQELSGE